ncbi:MAG: hypothetical protein QN174_06265 [Armatimonadota bacterium]|nr:hypothetical protein [Armatimonadota bacterium]MDR7422401.1 hypothetical protein [Armatimonadota bacterium]MDR7453965.1 hypothetical protein [Armatimonadota bacterium]MDR7457163.1 hypothetical protein [Armatimonadota bacterium]MDR7496545.1 hypothetical protein [Armatimonadota bacterium]
MREISTRRGTPARSAPARAPRPVPVRETDEELTARVAREVRRSLVTAVAVAAVAVTLGALLR